MKYRKKGASVHFSEERLPFCAMAWAVLTVFYGICFFKMLVQKRRGIRTHQVGGRKEPAAHTIEVWMSIATLAAVAVQILSVVLNLSMRNLPIQQKSRFSRV